MASIQTIELVDPTTGAVVRKVTDGKVTRDEAKRYTLRGFTDGPATGFSQVVKGNRWERAPGSYSGLTLTPYKNSNGTGATLENVVNIVVAEDASAPPVPPVVPPHLPPVVDVPTPPVVTPKPDVPPPVVPPARKVLFGVAGIPTVAQGELFGFQAARCFPQGVGTLGAPWVASGRTLVVAMAKQPWSLNVSAAEVETWVRSLVQTLPKGTKIEVGNEPNGKAYWKRSIADWNERVLLPAAKLLKSLGVFVIGTAAADGNASTHQAMLAADAYVDAWAVHPYGDTIAEHVNRLAAIRAMTAKPLWATEWNLYPQGGDPQSNWASKLQSLYDASTPYCDALFYYRIKKDPNIVRFDDGALYGEDGVTPNGPFFDAVKGMKR